MQTLAKFKQRHDELRADVLEAIREILTKAREKLGSDVVGIFLDYGALTKSGLIEIGLRKERVPVYSFWVAAHIIYLFEVWGEGRTLSHFIFKEGRFFMVMDVFDDNTIELDDERVDLDPLFNILANLEFIYSDFEDGLDLSQYVTDKDY